MDSFIHSVYYSDDTEMKPGHYHDCHQILFIKRGKVAVSINGTEHIAGEGDIVILSRFENHAVSVLSEAYERYVLRISPAASLVGDEYSFLTLRPGDFRNRIASGEYYELFLSIFGQLVRENTTDDGYTDRMRELLVSELFMLINRLEPMSRGKLEKEALPMILELQRELESNCREQYTLKQLAERYHISESTLSHRFKKMVGTSVFEYLYSCRIAMAKKQLAKTDMSISEVVDTCGFTDCANFSRTFKSKTGMTPTKFRMKYKETAK